MPFFCNPKTSTSATNLQSFPHFSRFPDFFRYEPIAPVKYSSLRYRCWECRITFNADEYRTNYLFGPNLSCWAIYQHIALRLSYEDLATSLNDVFGFSFGYSIDRKHT